jgi:hypothetical protein
MAFSRFSPPESDTRGHSSAVASVLYSRGSDRFEVTKSGSYIFDGVASNYHEWEFRTRLRMKAAGDEDFRYAEAMSKVVDGLRGDAFVVAKELGLDKIWHPGDVDEPAGVDVLVKAIKLHVFPQTTYEAKELFRQFCKPSGSLSRQNGESMNGYCSRRRRCWKLLTELDKEIVLSEGHRADLLLDLAGLDKNERTMVQASIGNSREFDKIAEALVVQHPRIHLTKSGKGSYGSGNSRPKGHGKKGSFSKGKGKGKRSWSAHLTCEDTAYLAADDDEPYSDPAFWYGDDYDHEADCYLADDGWEEPSSSCDYIDGDYSAYVAQEWSAKWEVEDSHECAELECVACLFDVLGPDCTKDPDVCAEFIQNGTAAFVATKGKGKGKGKGSGKSGKYPVRLSNLSIADRRKKLQELKA